MKFWLFFCVLFFVLLAGLAGAVTNLSNPKICVGNECGLSEFSHGKPFSLKAMVETDSNVDCNASVLQNSVEQKNYFVSLKNLSPSLHERTFFSGMTAMPSGDYVLGLGCKEEKTGVVASTYLPFKTINSVPVIDRVSVSPVTGFVDGVFSCNVSARDNDSDAISYSFEWMVGQKSFPTGSNASFACSPEDCRTGMGISCSVVPKDYELTGEKSVSRESGIASNFLIDLGADRNMLVNKWFSFVPKIIVNKKMTGQNLWFQWEFGDNNTSIIKDSNKAVHLFSKTGEYFVKAIAYDAQGNMASDNITVNAKEIGLDLNILSPIVDRNYFKEQGKNSLPLKVRVVDAIGDVVSDANVFAVIGEKKIELKHEKNGEYFGNYFLQAIDSNDLRIEFEAKKVFAEKEVAQKKGVAAKIAPIELLIDFELLPLSSAFAGVPIDGVKARFRYPDKNFVKENDIVNAKAVLFSGTGFSQKQEAVLRADENNWFVGEFNFIPSKNDAEIAIGFIAIDRFGNTVSKSAVEKAVKIKVFSENPDFKVELLRPLREIISFGAGEKVLFETKVSGKNLQNIELFLEQIDSGKKEKLVFDKNADTFKLLKQMPLPADFGESAKIFDFVLTGKALLNKSETFSVPIPKRFLVTKTIGIELLQPNPKTGETFSLNELRARIFYADSDLNSLVSQNRVLVEVNGKKVEFVLKEKEFVANYAFAPGRYSLKLKPLLNGFESKELVVKEINVSKIAKKIGTEELLVIVLIVIGALIVLFFVISILFRKRGEEKIGAIEGLEAKKERLETVGEIKKE